MTERDTHDRQGEPTDEDRISGPATSRRTYMTLCAAVPVAAGGTSSTVAAGGGAAAGVVSPMESVGYGEGGFGEGGYGGGVTDPVCAYTDEDGVVETNGLLVAIGDWRDDEIDTDILLDVIGRWRSGEPVEGC